MRIEFVVGDVVDVVGIVDTAAAAVALDDIAAAVAVSQHSLSHSGKRHNQKRSVRWVQLDGMERGLALEVGVEGCHRPLQLKFLVGRGWVDSTISAPHDVGVELRPSFLESLLVFDSLLDADFLSFRLKLKTSWTWSDHPFPRRNLRWPGMGRRSPRGRWPMRCGRP